MFSSPSGSARNRERSFSKSLSKAALNLVGSGPPLDKQLKEAIMEGNEDKAINIYTSSEGGKSLMRSLHVSKPFPSKKVPNTNETPLHLTAKYALAKLFVMFLEYGGNPGIRNIRGETCIHSACALSSNPFRREEIVQYILEWRSKNNEGNATEAVPIDMLDEDGNAGIHLAAHSNLLPCVELLINYGARLNIINKYNYSACEMADKAGFRVLGTMIELAWVFMFVDQQIEDTYLHHKFSADHQVARVVLDSHSLTLTRLVDFINQVIKFTAESIGESVARAEVMLTHYQWDATKLKKDWLANHTKVLKDVRLQPKSVPIPSEGANGTDAAVSPKSSNGSNSEPLCGLAMNDVFLDSCYKNVGPFSVLHEGKRVQYVIRTYNGKTGVYPLDQDPGKSSLTDPFISETSHINPKATEPCSICNERMFEPCSLNHFAAGTLVEAKRREIACGSGHKFCFGCWSDHLQAQVLRDNGNGVGCLPCPGHKCGEILDLQWAPVMLKSQDLLNRLLAQRQRHVIDCIGLRWCPVSNCGLLVHVNGPGLNKKSDFPQTAICANGHAFCLSCNREAHSPCSCANWTLWAENVREESKNANIKDPSNAFNILLGGATHKKCPQCSDLVVKEEGCNHMHCRKCRSEFCWICMQDWAMHADNQNGYFQCNRMMDDPQYAKHRDSGEEKDGNEAWNPSVYSNRAKSHKQILFIHSFSRFQAHGESMKLEAKVMEEAVSRISLGLQAAAEGDIKWLLGDSVLNPYMEKEETEDVFNHMRDLNVNDLKDTVISEYYLPKQECVEFLIDAFEELEKCRCFLKWSYPYALFEFDESFHKSRDSHSHKHDEHRIQFDLLQAALEASTERLSDVIARRRLRGTRSQIALATRTAKLKRLELEAVVLASSSSHPHEPSAGSSLSSWSSHLNEKKVVVPQLQQVPVPGTPLRTSSSDMILLNKTSSTGKIQGPPISAFMSPMPASNDMEESEEEVEPYKESPPASPRQVEPPQPPPAPQVIDLDMQDSMAIQRLMSVGFTKDEAVSTQMRMTERPFYPNAIYNFAAPMYDHATSDVAASQQSHQSYTRADQYQEVHSRTQTVQQQQQQYSPEPPRVHQHQEVVEQYSPPPRPPQQQQQYYQSPQHQHHGHVAQDYAHSHQSQSVHSQSMHSMSQYSEGQVEQRLIGAKKDPDSEALEHAILLSQQESEYGVNMYDALTPADEPVIDEYVAQGFTREESILIIFEEKYGKVSSQQRSAVTPAMPTVYNTIADEDHAKRSEEDEAQIIVLMARGYTREQACNQIDQDRERAAAAARRAANSSPPLLSPRGSSSNFDLTTVEEEQLTPAEEREVDRLLRTGVYRSESEAIADVMGRRAHSGSEEQQIVALMQLGYSRDQARQEYQRRQAANSARNGPVRNGPRDADQLAIDELMARGYSLDEATQMHYSALNGSGAVLASRSNSGGNVRSDDGRSRYSEATGSQYDRGERDYRDRDREMHRSGSGREYRSRDARSDSGRDLRDVRSDSGRGEFRDRGRQISSNRSDAGMSRSSRDVRSREREYGSTSRGGSYYANNNHGGNSFRNSEVYSVASSHDVESYYDGGGRDTYQRDPYSRPLPPAPSAAPAPVPLAARNADEQAMAVALLISQQESEFGINMYDSLTPADQPEIDAMVAQGYTADEAIQTLFDRRYRTRQSNYNGVRPMNGASMYGGNSNGMMPRMNSQPINQAFSRSGSNGSDYYGRQVASPQTQYDYPRSYQNEPPPPREASFFRASSMVGRSNGGSAVASPARSNSGGFSDNGDPRRGGGGRQRVRKSDVKRITDVLDVSEDAAIEALLANDCQVQPAIASLLR